VIDARHLSSYQLDFATLNSAFNLNSPPSVKYHYRVIRRTFKVPKNLPHAVANILREFYEGKDKICFCDDKTPSDNGGMLR
jgi:hypothetical protein